MENNPKYILIHCSDVSYREIFDQSKVIEAYHTTGHPQAPFPLSSLGFRTGYHTLYTGGKRYIRRDYADQGAHCNTVVDGTSMNFQSIAFCIGFDGDIEYPPQDELELMIMDIKEAMALYNIPKENILLHRHFSPHKTCAGSLIPDDWGQRLVTPSIKPPEEERKREILIELHSKLSLLAFLMRKLVELFKKK